ncbi:MAG: hypothetical protein IJM09_06660 [Neisseriaceae bacterium]|nr:hypothetical protein [Neisseriaceae bacterium]
MGEKSVSIVEILHYANAPFRMTNIFSGCLKKQVIYYGGSKTHPTFRQPERRLCLTLDGF